MSIPWAHQNITEWETHMLALNRMHGIGRSNGCVGRGNPNTTNNPNKTNIENTANNNIYSGQLRLGFDVRR